MLTRRRAKTAALPLHVQDFLLDVRRGAQEIERLKSAGVEYDSFYEFTSMPDDERRRLWQRHGATLRREAQRRGIALPVDAW